MTIIWCMVPEIWSMMDIFFVILDLFLPFYLPNNPKNQKDIIILHMFTINDKHMMYGSWDIEHDRCHCYFSFWTIFCPFTQVYQKSWPYAILFLRYGAWQMQLLFFILGYLLPYYPLRVQKIKIWKKWKKTTGDIIIYTYVYQTLWLDDVQFLRNGVWWTDRRIDGKSDT